MKQLLRPIQQLKTLQKSYPKISKFVDMFRDANGKHLPKWPDWCFLPMAAWIAMIGETQNVIFPFLGQAKDIAKLSAIGTWQYSQGVYRFDPDFMRELIKTPISGNLPCEVLYRLPEWCVYIETPDRVTTVGVQHGFWAHLEWDVNTDRSELRLLVDYEDCLLPLIVHIGDWSLAEGIQRALSDAENQGRIRGVGLAFPSPVSMDLAEQINPLISALIYLCSEEPEIDDTREPGTSPIRPRAKKTKKGLRFFPAENPRVWTVGRDVGEQLRQVTYGALTGRTVKPHLRRAHWHGFWTGPRQAERKFIYRWLSPLVIGGENE